MSIKPSTASEVRPLIESLGGADEIRREAAIARLAVIGARAVDRLAATLAAPDATRPTKVAVLRVLEAIADPRTIPLARRAIQEGGDVAVAGAAALRPLLASLSAGVSAEALDLLMTVVLDRGVEHRVRAAAFDALQDVPDVRDSLGGVLGEAPDTRTVDAVWNDAIEGRLSDSPRPLREAVQLRSAVAPLGTLQKLVDAVRAKEAGQASAVATEWRAVRGALHQALALRGSRVAVYDLRETIESASVALPSTFLTALHLVGDESCLAPIGAAYKRAAGDERWRGQLEAAYQAIVKRQKLSRKRWPGLKTRPTSSNTPSRTKPRR